MRVLTRLVACLCLLAFCGARVAAAAPSVVFDAVVGFDGYCVAGKWTPISVTAENLPRADKARQSLEAFEGACEARAVAGASGVEGIVFARPLSVAANDRKRVVLYAKFPSSASEVELSLADKHGAKAGRVRLPRKNVEPWQRLVVHIQIGSSPFSLPAVADMPLAVVAGLDPAQLPDKWYGYDGADLLVLPRMTERLFDKESAQAVRQWVAQGGKLLVLGGRNAPAYRGSLLDDLLPADYEDSLPCVIGKNGLEPKNAASDASEPAVQIDRMKPRPGAWQACESNGVALLYARRYHAGQVLYFASDWSPRLLQAVPVGRLLVSALAFDDGFGEVRGRFGTEFLFRHGEIFGLGQANRLPHLGLVFVLLLSYVALVGPANFLYLSRRKRLELAWITVPAIVLLYAGAIYGLSSLIKGYDSVFRVYHLVTGQANARFARCDSHSMLFVPNSGAYHVDAKEPEAAVCGYGSWRESLMQRAFGGGIAAAGWQGRVVQSPSGMSLPEKRVTQWTVDFSSYESVADLQGEVAAQLVSRGTALTGSVRNGTPHKLTCVHLAVGCQAWPLSAWSGARPGGVADALEAGAHAEIAFDAAAASGALKLQDALSARGDKHEQAVFAAFRNLLHRESDTPHESPSCFLFGFLEGKAPVGVGVMTRLTERSDHAFFALQVPLVADGGGGQAGDGPQTAPRLVSLSADSAWDPSSPSSVSVSRQAALLGFGLPASARGREPTFLRLPMTVKPGNSPAVQAFVWEPGPGRWLELAQNEGSSLEASVDIDRARRAPHSDRFSQIEMDARREIVHPITNAILLKVSQAQTTQTQLFNWTGDTLVRLESLGSTKGAK